MIPSREIKRASARGTAVYILLLGGLGACAAASPTTQPGPARPTPEPQNPAIQDSASRLGVSVKHIRIAIPADTSQKADDSVRIVTDTVIWSERDAVLHTTIPRGWPERTAWRPRRHYGPFQRGSHFEAIQLYVAGLAAQLHFNDYFSSFDDSFAEDVYRIYYRRNIATDPLSSATFPATKTPALGHFPGGRMPVEPASMINQVISQYPHGFAGSVLFALEDIRWSSRFGGSIALRFALADIEGPTLNREHAEDFEYEFGKYVSTSEWYLFDVSGAELILYVNPKPSYVNPKSNQQWGDVAFGVELNVTGVSGYRGSLPIDANRADSILKGVLDTVARSLAGSATSFGSWKWELSRYAHAFLHNQHQGVIATNEKVTALWISDDWLDLDTDVYVAYINAAWRIDRLAEQWDPGFIEGDQEWKVRFTVDHQYEPNPPEAPPPAPMRVVSRILEFEGEERSRWLHIAGLAVPECRRLSQIKVRMGVKDEDALSDQHFGRVAVSLILNCDAIEAHAGQPVYGGIVHGGVLVLTDKNIQTCGQGTTSPGNTQNVDFRDACLDPDGVLRGLIPGWSIPTEDFYQFERVWSARAQWTARVELTAR